MVETYGFVPILAVAMTSPAPPTSVDIRSRLAGVTLRDERRLGRRLDGIRNIRDEAKRQAAADDIAAQVAAAETRLINRQAAVPAVSYPAELPVSQRRDDIAAAIRDHQVVIVAGETGSGKTTQLPKICLELGRGVARPDRPHPAAPDRRPDGGRADRRGAGGTPLGGAVGYQVRFTDQVGDADAGQGDDRRHPAGRDPARPDC